MAQPEKKPLTPNEKAFTNQLSLKEYQALREKETRKQAKAFRLPRTVKWLLAIPLLLIFLFGVFYIPYLLLTTERIPSYKAQKDK